MKRIEGWETLLNDFILSRMNDPFKWASNDCCIFACDAILAITGVDPAGWFRGRYTTKDGAYALLAHFSGGEILATAEMIFKELGMLEIQPAFAKRGDVVLCKTDTVIGGIRETLGVVGMDGRVAIPGKNGLEFITIEKREKAWSV